ncbi:MAG TPA: beta-ketoacyl synthase N-terminal-like domain-containing protein, partial [Candidatus Binatus sp.]|nr:beta-ketoacyl synthase N-terminal-like domain-containing protein [Candidatus Binatus sp.]
MGSGVGAFWEGLVAGRTAVAPIASFPAEDLEPRNAAEVRDVPVDDPDRAGALALRAATEAVTAAQLGSVARQRMGIALGTTLGGMLLFERWVARESLARPERIPYYAPAVRLARMLGCRGPVATPQLACASGTHAIALAAEWVRRGR